MKLEFPKKTTTFLVLFITLLLTFPLCSSTFSYVGTQENEINPTDMNIRLELFTTDISKTVHYYQDVLGFKSLKSYSSTYQPIQKGQVVLGIGLLEKLGNNHYFNSYPSNTKLGFGVEIVLEVDDIQLIYNKVKLAKAEIESELKEQPWGLTDFRLTDPNGYYIRVTSKD